MEGTYRPDCGVPVLQLSTFVDAYMKQAGGPTKWTKLLDFLKSTYPNIVKELLARKDHQAKADITRLMDELVEAQRQANGSRQKAEQVEHCRVACFKCPRTYYVPLVNVCNTGH